MRLSVFVLHLPVLAAMARLAFVRFARFHVLLDLLQSRLDVLNLIPYLILCHEIALMEPRRAEHI
jgi:hypothetical protein